MDSLRKEAHALLDETSAMTLACTDGDGPWAADVYFVRIGSALYFFSSPESRHVRSFTEDPRAAATVRGTCRGWVDIRGLQMEGEVDEVRGAAEKSKALAAYLSKFPFARELLSGGGKLIAKVRFYRLIPQRTLLVDNSRGFGYRAEL